MLAKLGKYVQPQSLTWWIGTICIVSGVLQESGGSIPVVSDTVRPILDAFFPGGGGARILAGFALWGIRASPGMNR